MENRIISEELVNTTSREAWIAFNSWADKNKIGIKEEEYLILFKCWHDGWINGINFGQD